jgi:diguanylate cyclase (GGDEF)-like protein/PAS domain S-box-containing protein
MSELHTNLLFQATAHHFIKDLAGRYTYISPQLAQQLGVAEAQILGKTAHELFDPAIADEVRRTDQLVIDSRRPYWAEQNLTDARGQTTCFWTLKAPSLDAEGKVTGISGAIIDVTHHKHQEQELIDLKNRLAATLQASPDLIFEFDRAGTYLACHTASPELLAADKETLIGKNVSEVLPPAAAQAVLKTIATALATGHTSGHQIRLDIHGTPHWFELSAARMADTPAQSPHPHVILTSRDITARQQAMRALEERESLLFAIIDNTPMEYWARDLDGTCILENRKTVEHWGSILGTRPTDSRMSGETTALWQDNNRRAYAGETVDAEVSYRVDGEERTFRNVVSPIRVKDEIIGIVGFNYDITERKQAEEQIRSLAFYDPLTQLANRRLMFDRLNQALIGSGRRERQGALLLIDLDHFKTLNDTRGHDMGDRLLIEVATRLRGSLRHNDTAARLGGDEFVVILEDLDLGDEGARQAESLCEQLLQRLNQPYRLPAIANGVDYLHHCGASIGITLFTGPSVPVEELLRRCDTALYRVKASGRNAVRFYDPQMQAAMEERTALEADLRAAIEQQQLIVYYQPQTDPTGRIIGVEALLRWQHPLRGMIPPGQFIGLAEETGLILPIGDWVLEAACRQLTAWRQHPATAHLSIAVNVSARQFRNQEFTQKVQQLITEYSIAPGQLKIELTETLLLDDTEHTADTMKQLTRLGIGFSLDDFGTGYSSLIYLKKLPLDQLKIDQSFVRDILTDPSDAVIARTILVLGETLGMHVIAEGVETQAQMELLSQYGCKKFQGYYFGRPEPVAQLEQRLHAAQLSA